MCRPKHAEGLRNVGIINFTTSLHLLSYFYESLAIVLYVYILRTDVSVSISRTRVDRNALTFDSL